MYADRVDVRVYISEADGRGGRDRVRMTETGRVRVFVCEKC